MMKLTPKDRYRSFAEFYPFYLSQHSHRGTRILHFIGTLGGACVFLAAGTSGELSWLAALGAGLVFSYGCAWIAHFFIEKNRPATFRYPLYSFMGDFRMLWDLATRRIPFNGA